MADLGGVRGLFLQLARPIDFNAVDGLPVDLLFVLLSPLDAGADHLKALAGVSRMLRNEAVAARLRGAKNDEALYPPLADSETRDAASAFFQTPATGAGPLQPSTRLRRRFLVALPTRRGTAPGRVGDERPLAESCTEK